MTEWIFLVVVTIPFIVVWVATIVEVGRRPDLRRVRSVAWVVLLLLFPLIAVAVYVVVRTPRPKTLSEPSASDSRARRFVELAEQRQAS